MPKHIFWIIIGCSSLHATGDTRIQGVVLRRIGECGHFRSRDKDGGHTMRSAIAENPANFMALSFIELELLPIEVLHCGNREYRVFLVKNSGKYSDSLFAPRKGC